MRRRDTASLPSAVELTWQLWVWLDEHLPALPAFARSSAGAHAIDGVLRLLDELTRAAWLPRGSPEIAPSLARANHHVALLRLLLRGMAARQYLSHTQHAHAAERLEVIGRMVGAWLRSLQARRGTS